MSRIEELEKQITELDERKVALQHELEVEKQKEVKCPFKYGDEYFLLPSDGMVSESIWGDYKFDNGALSQGNIFKTKEEAIRERDRRLLLTRFRQFRDKCNGDWKPDWKDKCEDKYCVLFNHELSELVLNWYIYVQPFESFGCFKNREDAIRAIELFGDEIIRLWADE